MNDKDKKLPPSIIAQIKAYIDGKLNSQGTIADRAAAYSEIQKDAEDRRAKRRRVKKDVVDVPDFYGANAGAPKKKQYSQLTKNLARQIERMGPNVPADVKQAAMEAAAGKGATSERDLQDKLRAYTGIARSGGKEMRRQVGQIRGIVRTGAQIASTADLVSRGAPGAGLAVADLFMRGTGAVEKLTKNKTVQNMFIKAADTLFNDPSIGLKFLRSAGRVLQVAGPLGAAIQTGLEIGNSIGGGRFDNAVRSDEAKHAAINARFDAGLFSGTGAPVGQEISMSARAQVEGGRGRYAKIMDYLGFNADTEEAIKDKATQHVGNISKIRELGGAAGIPSMKLLEAYATKQGVAVEDLNDYERAQALNGAAAAQYDKLKVNDFSNQYVKTQLALLSKGKKAYAETESPEQMQARVDALRDEAAGKQVNGIELAIKDRKAKYARYIGELPKAEKQERDRAMRDAIMSQKAYESRRKMVWDD